MDNVKLLSDQALCESVGGPSDGLGFDAYASVLASAAENTSGPFTIGVFGEWGTGKTSLMRLVEEKLSGNQKVVTVWFNAWRYEQEEHPIVPLVGTIVKALETHEGFAGKMKQTAQAMVRALRAVAYGFAAKSKIKVPGFAEIEASFVAKDMIEREKALTPDPLLDRSLYYEAFESLSKVKLDSDTRVVVLIDDLDRCFPDQAIRLLESIKLVLSQPGFIFFLGVARQVIEGYLKHRYSNQYGIQNFKGQLYLDKMVQLAFSIPPNTGRTKALWTSMRKRLDPNVAKQLNDVLPPMCEALGGNPRAVVRFINNLLIDLAISSRVSSAEIPIQFFAVTRCLQQRWPNVLLALTTKSQLAQAVSQWDREMAQKEVQSAKLGWAEVATAIVSDDELWALLRSPSGKEWLTEKDKRDASVNFLRTEARISPGERARMWPPSRVLVFGTAECKAFTAALAHRFPIVGLTADEHSDRVPESVPQLLTSAPPPGLLSCVCLSAGISITDEQWSRLDALQARWRSGDKSFGLVLPVLLPGFPEWELPLQHLLILDFRKGFSEGLFRKQMALLAARIGE